MCVCTLVQALRQGGQQRTMSADKKGKETRKNEERCCANCKSQSSSSSLFYLMSFMCPRYHSLSLFLSLSRSLARSLSLSLSLSLPFSFFLSPFPLTYAGFLLGANKEQYFILFFFCFKRRAVARHLIIIV